MSEAPANPISRQSQTKGSARFKRYRRARSGERNSTRPLGMATFPAVSGRGYVRPILPIIAPYRVMCRSPIMLARQGARGFVDTV
jgi:hypothetical protein